MTNMVLPINYAAHGRLTIFSQSNDGNHTWRNNMDVVWDPGVGAPGPTEPVIVAFHDFIKGIQRDDCKIIKMSLRPWTKGNVPFDEEGNIWESVEATACKNWGSGTAHPSDSNSGFVTPGEIGVLMVKSKFGPGGGKPGRLFLRNVLNNTNITASPGGPPILGAGVAAAYISDVNTWAHTKLDAYCEDNPLPRFLIVHAAKVNSTTYNVFDTAVVAPQFQACATHDIGKN